MTTASSAGTLATKRLGERGRRNGLQSETPAKEQFARAHPPWAAVRGA